MSQKGLISLYQCKFQLTVTQVKLLIKFPCVIYVVWQQINKQNSVSTVQKIKLSNGVGNFNETLQFSCDLIFDQELGQFVKKQTLVIVHLISATNNIPKQVGRVSVDLAKIANNEETFLNLKSHKLTYCPMNDANLTFSIILMSKYPLERSLNEIDRDTLNQYRMIHPRQTIKIKNNTKQISESEIKHEDNFNSFKSTIKNVESQERVESSKVICQTQRIKAEQKSENLPQNLPQNTQKQKHQEQQQNYNKRQNNEILVDIDKEVQEKVKEEQLDNQPKQLKIQSIFSGLNKNHQGQAQVDIKEQKQFKIQDIINAIYEIRVQYHADKPMSSEEIIQKNTQAYFTEQITEQQSKIQQLTEQNAKIKQKIKEMDKQNSKNIAKLTQQLKRMQAQLASKINQPNQNNHYSEIIIQLQEQIQRRDGISEDYNNKIDQNMHLKYELSEIKNTILQLNNALVQKNTEIEKLKFQLLSIPKLEGQQSKDKQKQYVIQELNQYLSKALQQKLALESQKLQSGILIEELKDKLQASQKNKHSQFQQLNNVINELKTQIVRLQLIASEAEQSNSRIKKLEIQIAQLEQVIVSQSQQSNKLKIQIKKLEQIKTSEGQQSNTENKETKLQIQYLNKIIEQKNAESAKFAQKQLKMRQNLVILQQQSKNIFKLIQTKQQSEQYQLLKIEQQESIIQKLSQANDQLAAKLCEHQQKLQQGSLIVELQKKYQEERNQNANLKLEIQYMRTALEQSMNRPDEVNVIEELNSLKNKYQQVKNLNQKLLEEKNNFQIALQRQESNRINIQAEKDFLEQLKEELYLKNSQMENQIKKLNQKNDQLLEKINLVTLNKTETMPEISQVKEHRDQISQEKQDSIVYNQNKQLSILRSLQIQKQSQLQSLRQQIINKDQSIQDLNKLNVNLVKQNQNIWILQQKLENLNNNLKKSVEELNNLQLENTNLKNTIYELQYETANLKRQLEQSRKIDIKTEITKDNQTIDHENVHIQNQQLQNALALLKQQLSETQNILSRSKQQKLDTVRFYEQKIQQLLKNYEQQKKASDLNILSLMQQNQELKEAVSLSKNTYQDDKFVQKNQPSAKIAEILQKIKHLLQNKEIVENQKCLSEILTENRKNIQYKIGNMTQEKGLIQQKAKALSMQFYKVKSFILKSKTLQQKISLLQVVKPSEKIIRQMVEISQTLFNNNIRVQTSVHFEV